MTSCEVKTEFPLEFYKITHISFSWMPRATRGLVPGLGQGAWASVCTSACPHWALCQSRPRHKCLGKSLPHTPCREYLLLFSPKTPPARRSHLSHRRGSGLSWELLGPPSGLAEHTGLLWAQPLPRAAPNLDSPLP